MESFYHFIISSFYLPFRSMGISSTGTRAFVFDYGGTLLHKEKVWKRKRNMNRIRNRNKKKNKKSYEGDDDGDEDGEDGDGKIWGEGNETEIINGWYKNEKKIKRKE